VREAWAAAAAAAATGTECTRCWTCRSRPHMSVSTGTPLHPFAGSATGLRPLGACRLPTTACRPGTGTSARPDLSTNGDPHSTTRHWSRHRSIRLAVASRTGTHRKSTAEARAATEAEEAATVRVGAATVRVGAARVRVGAARVRVGRCRVGAATVRVEAVKVMAAL